MALLEGLLQVLYTYPLLAAVLLLVAYLHCSGIGSSSNPEGKEPPGPKGLPVLGNLLQLDLKRPYETLCELSKKYGSVFTIHFGPKKVVVLAGYKTVRQALVNHAEEFGDRDITPIFHDINKGHGILFANGENWKTMRRFALSNLRDFGMGKKGSEEKIITEISFLMDVFESFKGEPFDTTQPVSYAVSNVICAIVYGSRFEYDDPKFKAMVQRANDNIRLSGSPSVQLYNMFPRLKPWVKNLQQMLKNNEVHVEEMKRIIRGLQETLNPQEPRGFVDSFLVRKQDAEEGEQKDSLFHENNLTCCVTNLFAAGTDTSGTTLRWGLLLMAKYPHIQERVHEEIDRVLDGRQPLAVDRKSLPYTEAVIHETQRIANIVPMSLPHTTSCDAYFQGYHIKKGTTVIPLLTSVLKDESEWANPYTFHPEHFLDDQGCSVKRDAFIPFSAGRRVCLGESLARMEVFLFFASLLQRFRFTAPPGVSEDELDLRPAVGLILSPSAHKLCAVPRS
ncbi:cytochrome P450 2K1-like [Engraulis encrasicolus]|uniref:cytochrome P450 2K1-like n=1 Tax=Engraulis encrasicolus TaxID=184585 RepID=UPI002FD6284B